MTLISSEDSASFMKFSPSVCVAVVASVTREVAVRIFAYHAHGTNPAVIHDHDKTSAMHARSCRLAPPMIIILLVYSH